MNTYQYNKRGEVSGLSDYKIDSITDAIKDDDGSGNDDSRNTNEATQNYIANAQQNGVINVANKGSTQAFTIAEFNAGCDDHDLAAGSPSSVSI